MEGRMPETAESLFALQGQRAPAVNPSLVIGLVHAQKPSKERVINSCLLAEPLNLATKGVLGLLLEKIGNGLELHDTLHRFALRHHLVYLTHVRCLSLGDLYLMVLLDLAIAAPGPECASLP